MTFSQPPSNPPFFKKIKRKNLNAARSRRLLGYAAAAGTTLSVGLGLAAADPAEANPTLPVQDPDQMLLDTALGGGPALGPIQIPARPVLHSGADGTISQSFNTVGSLDLDDDGFDIDATFSCFGTEFGAAGFGLTESELLVPNTLGQSVTFTAGQATVDSFFTPLNTTTPFYVGLRWNDFNEGGTTHLGWVRLEHVSGNICKITGYAFTDQPSIRTGFTPTAVTLQHTSAETPTSRWSSYASLVLAVVSGALLGMRRRLFEREKL